MKTRDELQKLSAYVFINELSKIILFGGDDSKTSDFLKWTKPVLLEFYRDWKHYGKDGVHQLTMKSHKEYMRYVVGDILYNRIRQVVSDNVGIPSYKITREDVLDYLTTIRREIIINELIN